MKLPDADDAEFIPLPDAQRALAKRIGVKTTTLDASHVPMVSQPHQVAEVIVAAAQGIAK